MGAPGALLVAGPGVLGGGVGARWRGAGGGGGGGGADGDGRGAGGAGGGRLRAADGSRGLGGRGGTVPERAVLGATLRGCPRRLRRLPRRGGGGRRAVGREWHDPFHGERQRVRRGRRGGRVGALGN